MPEKNFEKLIKNTKNFGLTMFLYSKDKIEDIVDKMVEKGEISKYEAEDILQSFLKKAKQERDEIKKISKESISEYLDLNEYVKKSDLDEYIKSEVERILKEEE